MEYDIISMIAETMLPLAITKILIVTNLVIWLTWLVMVVGKYLKPEFRKMISKWQRGSKFSKIAILLFVFSLIAYGSIKPGAGPNNAPSSPMFNPGMSFGSMITMSFLHPIATIPDWAVEYDRWNIRGGYEDGFAACFTNTFSYVWGTNNLSQVVAFANGKIADSFKCELFELHATTNVISAIPGISSFWHGYDEDSGRYIFRWNQFGLDRSTNELVDAQIELYNPWRCATTFGNEEHLYVYGQLVDGVPECQTPEYAEWVDDQIGSGETNGLYKLSISISPFGWQDALLEIGTNKVLSTGGETYSFVLEKGVEYELRSYPFVNGWSECIAVDDVPDVPTGGMLLASAGFGGNQWTVDGGLKIDLPTVDSFGRCIWMPTFSGAPNVGHFDVHDNPIEFYTMLSDYAHEGNVEFCWETSDDNLHFATPNSPRSILVCDSLPTWREVELSVKATIGTNILCSTLEHFSYGIYEMPQGTNGIEKLSIKAEDGSPITWDDVLLDGEGLKLEVELGIACDSIDDFVATYSEDISLDASYYSCTSKVTLASAHVPLSSDSVVKVDKYHYIISVGAQWLQNENLVCKGEDGYNELTTIDMSSSSFGLSQRTDSDIINGILQRELRGMVRGAGDANAIPPEGTFNLRSLQAAGFVLLEASSGGVKSPFVRAQQQSDLVYYSGHGMHNTGKLMNNCGVEEIVNHWDDIDVFVIAGCSVLDVGNYRLKSTGFLNWVKHRSQFGHFPGEAWENSGPAYLLGYAWKAPRDDDGGNAIAHNFKENLNAGQDYITAWKNANDCDKGRNACAIDCSQTPHRFWYWDETTNIPVWTMKTKGESVWPNE